MESASQTESPAVSAEAISRPVRWAAYAFLALSMVVLVLIRVRLAPIPLERDDGEYAFAGQLVLQGVPPFAEIYNMKMPGIYWAYAAVMALFGQTPTGIHAGLLMVNLLTVVIAFRLASRVCDSVTASMMAGAYAWLSVGDGVLGAFAHAEHFVVLFVLLGLFLLPERGRKVTAVRLFLAGLGFGVAFTMKQHAAPFVLYGSACAMGLVWKQTFLFRSQKYAYCVAFACGVVLPFAAICLVMLRAGVFDRFWFWTFTYAWAYVSQVSVSDASVPFVQGLIIAARPALAFWLLAAIGVAALRRKSSHELLFGGLLVAGLIAISPGFYFREHYFVLMLPAVAALSVLGVKEAVVLLGRRWSENGRAVAMLSLLLVAIGQTAFAQRQYLFVAPPFEVVRTIFGTQPFAESVEIGRYIREHSSREDRIAVLGSEPQIYFYAQRRSATPFFYMYPLMESHGFAETMQLEMIRSVERERPKFIVQINHPASWLIRGDSQRTLLDWYPAYIQSHYRQIGMFDLTPQFTEYFWDEEMAGRSHFAEYTIDVFVRAD